MQGADRASQMRMAAEQEAQQAHAEQTLHEVFEKIKEAEAELDHDPLHESVVRQQ